MSFRVLRDKILNDTVNNSTLLSEVVDLDFVWGMAVSVTWSGAGTAGTIKLQGSIDGITWFDLPSLTTAVAGPGSVLWNVADVFYNKVRVHVLETNAADLQVEAWINAKGI